MEVSFYIAEPLCWFDVSHDH